ncbi:hypothetical protein ACSW29_23940 [Rhodococcus sp. GB-02]
MSSSTQSAFAALSTTIVDPNELVAQTSWWCTLTRKPREEGPEIRLVVVAENVVARIISDPSWTHPELRMIASAAQERLRLRSNTPTLPVDDGNDQLARARAEWGRRHVVAAQAEAALVDRIAALRAYEEAALTPIGAALNNL